MDLRERFSSYSMATATPLAGPPPLDMRSSVSSSGMRTATTGATGTFTVSQPLHTSPGRAGFSPSLALEYDSGAGDGPFGLGWRLVGAGSAITRMTTKGVPQYNDEDVFELTSVGDLLSSSQEKTIGSWRIRPYVPRIQASAVTRIEQWTDTRDADNIHWRVISADNVTTIFGTTDEARVFWKDEQVKHVFSWLESERYDGYGNAIQFDYKNDGSQRYLKRLRYSNTIPNRRQADWEVDSAAIPHDGWLFEVVFDYGEHDVIMPTCTEDYTWPLRLEPLTSRRSGFAVRIARLCRRLLVFHHIPGALDGVLVSSTRLDYNEELHPSGAALLVNVTQSGHAPGRESESLSPAKFRYATGACLAQCVPSMMPLPPHRPDAQWIDLNGDGQPGLLDWQADEWLYHRRTSITEGSWHTQAVPVVPSAIARPWACLDDVDGDGGLALVVEPDDGSPSGYYARTVAGGWVDFVPFASLPSISLRDTRLRRVDLTGNGTADLLSLTNPDGIGTWSPSQGRAGFGPSRVVFGPAVNDADLRGIGDAESQLYTADMTGDGLSDLVLVQDGKIVYWPNLGHGRFGPKVIMAHTPLFGDGFTHERIRLADLTGSGTADLLYLPPLGGVDVFYNCAGNGWSARHQLSVFPPLDRLSSIVAIDLLGQGTACLCWTADGPLGTSLQYVDLVAGQRPGLLVQTANGCGLETDIVYSPSTRFSLADERAGTPWTTRLPFPVQCVQSMCTTDYVTQSRTIARFAYHHGYYDGPEREFRGFGLVEQWEQNESRLGSGTHTKNWFHLGLRGGVSALVFGQPVQSMLDDSSMEQDTIGGNRALKGQLLRQEVYVQGNASAPFRIVENIYRADPFHAGGHRILLAETVSAEHGVPPVLGEPGEQSPRLSHSITLQVDPIFFLPTHTAHIVYGIPNSSLPDAQDRRKQQETVIEYRETNYTNPIDTTAIFRAPTACEVRIFRVLLGETSDPPRRGLLIDSNAVAANQLAFFRTATEIPFEDAPSAAARNQEKVCKVVVSHTRTYYRTADLTTHLPLGAVEPFSVLDRTYQLAFTPGLLLNAFADLAKWNPGIEKDLYVFSRQEGGYCDLDDDSCLWAPSGSVRYTALGDAKDELRAARMTFYTPILQLDALEHKLSIVEFDSYYLLPLKVTDAVGNITTLINDYVALQASCTIDANGNKTTLAFDSFSRTVGIAVAGKEGEGVGDSLDDFVAQPTDDQIVSLLDDPTGPKARVLIGKAGQRMVYRNAEYTAGMYVPASYVTVTRDVHAEDTAQLAVDISYLDGMARPIQTASLAIKDAGSGTTTWRINGAEVRDADGLPVKRFLAMFAQSHQFVPYTMLSEAPGIIYFRDPAQRLIGELYPDHTWTKTCITPWRTTKFDTGDTVLAADPAEDRDLGPYFQSLQRNSYKPTWYQNRSRSGNKWDQDAAAKSRQYNSTPTITHFDPLERAIAVVVDNSSKGKYVSQQEFDLLGNPACVWNARGAAVTVALFSLLSCELARTSMDSGQRWTFPDCLGRPLLVWNSRGIRERATYDELGRLTGTWLLPSWGMDEQLVEKRVYGEGQSDATNRNLRGKLVQCYDQSGIWENIEFDFKGNCVLRQVRLACEYKELIDWSVPENPLEETVYKSIHLFNARNQAWKTMAPDGSWTKRTYDVAGMLKTVSFAHASEKDKWTHYIESITYTADREEQVIQYGNKAVTERIFNRETRELDQTVTSRPGSDSRKRQVLVDLQYYRDCCARVTHVLDGAAQDVYFRNSRIEPGQDYAYDAIGQLTEARGREQVDVSHGGGRGLGPYSSGKSSGMLPGDGTRMCRYLEQYKYDSSGNITQMRHIAENDPSIAGWTRDYQYKEPSRLNPANATCDQLSYTTVRGCTEGYSYDERGCMISMPGYSSLTWDFHDRLRSSSTQIVNNGVPEMTWYVYNADGIRIRKVTEGATNLATGRPYQLKETRYFQEYQEYCTSAGKGLQSKLVKKTSKVKREARSTENSSVIALVEYTPLSTTSPSLLPRYQISECLELTGAAQIISYTEYSPYGTTTFASLRNALEAPRQYQFALYERDTETGMHCCGARYYAAWIGRWSSPDPSGIADGPNRYCYVGNDPVRFEDGTGLMRRQDHPGRPDRGGKDNHPGNRPTPYQRPKQASSSQKKDEQGPGSSKSAGDSAITANTKPPGDPPPGRPKEQNSFTVNSDVYVRFQEPHLDQDPVDARVRQKEWATNEGQVTSACRNFFNSGEKPNIMLWRTLDDQTLQYAGYYSSPHALDMVPQSNLSRKNVQISFILPSGVHRLGGPDSQVRANTSDSEVWTSTNIGAVDGIFGINGTLDPETDYAYTTALSFRQDIKSWKNSSDPKVDHIEVHATKMNGDPVLIRIPMRGLK